MISGFDRFAQMLMDGCAPGSKFELDICDETQVTGVAASLEAIHCRIIPSPGQGHLTVVVLSRPYPSVSPFDAPTRDSSDLVRDSIPSNPIEFVRESASKKGAQGFLLAKTWQAVDWAFLFGFEDEAQRAAAEAGYTVVKVSSLEQEGYSHRLYVIPTFDLLPPLVS